MRILILARGRTVPPEIGSYRGECLSLEIELATTIRDLKLILYRVKGSPFPELGLTPARQALSFRGEPLGSNDNSKDESRSLSDYGIEDGSELGLRLKLIRIFIRTRERPLCPQVQVKRGLVFDMVVEPSSTVREIKMMIQARVKGSPSKQLSLEPARQALYFREVATGTSDRTEKNLTRQALDESLSLSSIGVQDGSELLLKVLSAPLPEVTGQLPWHKFTGEDRSLVPKRPHVEGRIHRTPMEQRLFFKHGGHPELKNSFAPKETEQLNLCVRRQVAAFNKEYTTTFKASFPSPRREEDHNRRGSIV
uniref:Ubiquitin-like domain-containing protein n=1 Tax=Octactis speculum TaxID=3111310 RepID=A0A7S2GPZ3_9STRA|mmetsp:Transcript_53352/g.72900  ORF Transcript_53352/g.72900 Transcript_53352/m.72900 type:complete len:309 (+) Transcript_53352:29-955(+)